MEIVTLKNSDLTVSRLCFGGCPLGGHGWGIVDDRELERTIQSAVEHGINFFDTADTYGLGKSETLLGKAIQSQRKNVIIATKFGVVVEDGHKRIDNSIQWIQKALENSLKRLDTDYIDLYQIHYLKEDAFLDEMVEKLELFREQGKIRYFGLSNLTKNDYERIKPYQARFVSFQNEYSLAKRDNEEDILFLSQHLDLTPMTWGSLGQGILSGKYSAESKFDANDRRSREEYTNFHGSKLPRNLQIVNKMREISKESNRSLPSIALRFILDILKDSVVLVGIKNINQLKENLSALDWTLTDKQHDRLNQISSMDTIK